MNEINQTDYSLGLEAVTGDKLSRLVEDTFECYDARSEKICSEVSRLQRVSRNSVAELVDLVKGAK